MARNYPKYYATRNFLYVYAFFIERTGKQSFMTHRRMMTNCTMKEAEEVARAIAKWKHWEFDDVICSDRRLY